MLIVTVTCALIAFESVITVLIKAVGTRHCRFQTAAMNICLQRMLTAQLRCGTSYAADFMVGKDEEEAFTIRNVRESAIVATADSSPRFSTWCQ